MIEIQFNIQKPISIKGNLFAYPGKITLLSGPTGSGKSTIIYRLIGKRNSGIIKYKFYGQEVTTKMIQDEIGIVYQSNILINDYTLRMHIELLPNFNEQMIKDTLDLMKRLNLNISLDQKAKQLSGGEKQRFSFILALIKSPKLLVMDEPTSALDYDNKINFLTILKKEIEEKQIAVIMTSHDLDVLPYIDEQAKIADGKVSMESKKEIKEKIAKRKDDTYRILKLFTLFNFQRSKSSAILPYLLITLSISVLFFLDSIYIQRVNSKLDEEKVAVILQTKPDSHISEIEPSFIERIRDMKEVKSVDYSSLHLYQTFNIQEETFNELIGIQSYFDIDQVEFIKYKDDTGCFINQEDAIDYHLTINDKITINNQDYTITGLMNNYHPLYAKYNGFQIYVKDNSVESSNVAIVEIYNHKEIDSIIQKIHSMSNLYSCSLSNYNFRTIKDYTDQMMKIEKIVSFIVIFILMVLISVYTIKSDESKYSDYAYLLANSMNKVKLSIYISLLRIINYLPLCIIVIGISKYLFHFYSFFTIMVILLIVFTSIISVVPIWIPRKFDQYIRLHEYSN